MPLTVGVLGVLSLLALAYCVLDVATSSRADVRGLPKPLWFLVLLLPLVGPVLWWVFGRPAPGSGRARPTVLPGVPPPSSNPDDDAEFLRELRRRADRQRRESDGRPAPGDDERPA